MKISTLITNLVLMLGLAIAMTVPVAADPGYGRPGMGGGMGMMMPIQQRMETMRQQMNAINQTHDPKQQQRLLNEHWQSMGEMSDMMGMMMSMMMGGTQAGAMGQGPGSDAPMMQGGARAQQAQMPSVEEMWERQQEMQRWMSAMQGMMEQMLQHEQQRWRYFNRSD